VVKGTEFIKEQQGVSVTVVGNVAPMKPERVNRTGDGVIKIYQRKRPRRMKGQSPAEAGGIIKEYQ